MVGAVDGYKWNISDSYNNNINQRVNVNNKEELGQKGVLDADNKDESGKKGAVDADDRSKTKECQTCKNRKYVDGSNEANVSFKNAAHVSPEAASSAVRAHEGQHVSNAYNKAATQNGEVVSASVRVQTSVCPECGRSYVSGGVTDTQIRYYNESNPYQQDLKQTDGIKLRGANVDEIG